MRRGRSSGCAMSERAKLWFSNRNGLSSSRSRNAHSHNNNRADSSSELNGRLRLALNVLLNRRNSSNREASVSPHQRDRREDPLDQMHHDLHRHLLGFGRSRSRDQ